MDFVSSTEALHRSNCKMRFASRESGRFVVSSGLSRAPFVYLFICLFIYSALPHTHTKKEITRKIEKKGRKNYLRVN